VDAIAAYASMPSGSWVSGAEPCRIGISMRNKGCSRISGARFLIFLRRTMWARPTACGATLSTNISAVRRGSQLREACCGNAGCAYP